MESTWIWIRASLNHRKKMKVERSRLIPRKHTDTLVLEIACQLSNRSHLGSGGTRGLSQRGKHTRKGPTSQQSEKGWEMIVNRDVDFYAKTRYHRKTLRKAQKTTKNWKPKEYYIPNFKLSWVRFSHLSCQEAVLTPTPVSYATVPKVTNLGQWLKEWCLKYKRQRWDFCDEFKG